MTGAEVDEVETDKRALDRSGEAESISCAPAGEECCACALAASLKESGKGTAPRA